MDASRSTNVGGSDILGQIQPKMLDQLSGSSLCYQGRGGPKKDCRVGEGGKNVGIKIR